MKDTPTLDTTFFELNENTAPTRAVEATLGDSSYAASVVASGAVPTKDLKVAG